MKQRNHCVSLLRKTKREYYSNLDDKKICDSKTFWKIVKSMLSKKIKSNERITLIENDEIIKTEKGTTKVLKIFFSNIVQNLDIQQYNVDDPICENINDPLLKAIVDIETIQALLQLRNFAILNLIFPLKTFKRKKFLKN